VIFLSGFVPPRACAVEEIFVGYTQPCLRVVGWWSVDIPTVVWGLCISKVGGVISCLVGPIVERGHSVPTQCCLSLQYLCCYSLCVRGLGSVCYIWCNSPVLFGVLCEFKYVPSNSLSLSLPEDLSPRIMPQDYLV
jgi:hypothetical protein